MNIAVGDKVKFKKHSAKWAKSLRWPKHGDTLTVLELIDQLKPGLKVQDLRGRTGLIYACDVEVVILKETA